MRARSPRFKPGISRVNVETCRAVLQQLDYHGPLALAWDDTALEPAISLYQESKDGACIILGSSRGPIEVTSEAEFDGLFKQASDSKAEKVSNLSCVFYNGPK
jgi:hypothetical protein